MFIVLILVLPFCFSSYFIYISVYSLLLSSLFCKSYLPFLNVCLFFTSFCFSIIFLSNGVTLYNIYHCCLTLLNFCVSDIYNSIIIIFVIGLYS